MKIVIASENPDKIKEMQHLLHDLPLDLLLARDLNVPFIPETGLSFVENALLKARQATQYTNLPAIADDSGLCVEALGGAPGIYSARYAGEDANAIDNIQKLLLTLKDIQGEDRRAHYYCAIVLVRHYKDPTPIICQAQWDGLLLDHPQGEGGFGYDPIFYIPTLNCTVAQLSNAEKNKISHRGKALRELVNQLKGIYKPKGEFLHTKNIFEQHGS